MPIDIQKEKLIDLDDGCDLCKRCPAGFLDWLRSGNPDLAAVDGPGGAISSTAVASMAMS